MLLHMSGVTFDTKTQIVTSNDHENCKGETMQLSIKPSIITGTHTTISDKTYPFNGYWLLDMKPDSFYIRNGSGNQFWVKKSNIDFLVSVSYDFGYCIRGTLYIGWNRKKWSSWSFNSEDLI